MGWNRDNVTADDIGARRAVDTRRRSHRLAVLTFTAFLVSATVAGLTAHAGTTGTQLSDQQRAVSAIAIQNGDRQFLMLDKSRGELLLFVDGQPVFQGAALVGESRADEIPPYLFNKPFSVPAKLAEKVTPAGLYTVRRETDPHDGTIFTINEIKGTDWDITIHRVAIVPGERRPERIRSPNAADRHITNGCINVERETIGFLERYVTGPVRCFIFSRRIRAGYRCCSVDAPSPRFRRAEAPPWPGGRPHSMPQPTAAADPLLLPPGVRARSQGLRVPRGWPFVPAEHRCVGAAIAGSCSTSQAPHADRHSARSVSRPPGNARGRKKSRGLARVAIFGWTLSTD